MDAIVGVKITRQGVRRYIDVFEKRIDPRGKTYYWLAGEVLEDVPQPGDDLDGILTDVQAIRENYITVTPLHYNLTSAPNLEKLQQLSFAFPM
jgi:5'-nucleotidase